MKVLECLYSSIDDDGMFWAYADSGGMQRIVDEDRINRFMIEPPDDTRAWLRAQILRKGEGMIDDVDWDRVVLRVEDDQWSSWISYRYPALEMHDPRSFTRAQCESILENSSSLIEGLRELGLEESHYQYRSVNASSSQLTYPIQIQKENEHG